MQCSQRAICTPFLDSFWTLCELSSKEGVSMITAVRLSKDYGFTSDSAGAQLETLLGATERRRREARPLSIDCSGIAISRNSLLALTKALASNDPPIVSLNLNCTSHCILFVIPGCDV